MLSFLSLIPLPVRLGLAGAAAGAIFAGGWTVQGWHDAGKLDAEKAAHQADVTSIKNQWQTKLDLEHAAYMQAVSDRDAERTAYQKQRQDAEDEHEKTVAKLKASSARATADAQRLRDDFAAAIAASRATSGNDSVRSAGGQAASARCGGPGGEAACRFLDRALDLAKRCADVAGEQHAAAVEAVSAWPK